MDDISATNNNNNVITLFFSKNVIHNYVSINFKYTYISYRKRFTVSSLFLKLFIEFRFFEARSTGNLNGPTIFFTNKSINGCPYLGMLNILQPRCCYLWCSSFEAEYCTD